MVASIQSVVAGMAEKATLSMSADMRLFKSLTTMHHSVALARISCGLTTGSMYFNHKQGIGQW